MNLRKNIDGTDYFDLVQLNEMQESYSEITDLSRPFILAEIAPERLFNGYPNLGNNYRERGYNLIFDHHPQGGFQ